MRIALITNAMPPAAIAEALAADFVGITKDASIPLGRDADIWGAVAARIGSRAYPLHLRGREMLTAAEAVGEGVADTLVPAGADPLKWPAEWVAGRSELALAIGAELIRSRGGDPLERIAFARLFATGEPQRGLDAFLGKQKPDWRRSDRETSE